MAPAHSKIVVEQFIAADGGGQVLRIGALVAAFHKVYGPGGVTFVFDKIREKKGGRGGGLRPQHEQCMRLLMKITGATMTGVFEGSKRVTVTPGEQAGPEAGNYENMAKDDSASSVTLIIQSILPALILAPGTSVVTLVGGLDVPFSPPLGHTVAFLELLFGDAVNIEVVKHVDKGKGGGVVKLTVRGLPRGARLPALHLDGVDAHIADQVMVYMVLGEGSSSVTAVGKPTSHCERQIVLLEILTGVKIEVEYDGDRDTTRYSCVGLGVATP